MFNAMLQTLQCRKIRPRLWDAAAGRLSSADVQAIEAHLSSCAACATEAERTRGVVEVVHAAGASAIPVADDGWSAIRSAIASGSASQGDTAGRRGPVRSLAVAGVAASAGIVLVLLPRFGAGPDRVAVLRPPASAPVDAVRGASDTQMAGVPLSRRDGDGRTAGATGLAEAFHRHAPEPRGATGRGGSPLTAAVRGGDDLTYVNMDGPAALAKWAPVSSDDLAAIQQRIDRTIERGDDFVHVPFPQVASSGASGVKAAIRAYRQEKEVVDARLERKATLQVKGLSFQELCEQITRETGIEFGASRSVRDDKVTIFCKDRPLRDIMRRINRLFGFYWRRDGEADAFRYELNQDLRTQLMEEELRNRDRNEALIALDNEMSKFAKFLDLTPEQARERAKTATGDEKRVLEQLGGTGWGPVQMYGNLSGEELAALRNGQNLQFASGSRDGYRPLPQGLSGGVLGSMPDLRFKVGDNDIKIGNETQVPDGLPPSQIPGAEAFVGLNLDRSELGEFSLNGTTGVGVSAGDKAHGQINRRDPLAKGVSPSVKNPENAKANAKLKTDLALRRPVSIEPQASCTFGSDTYSGRGSGSGATQGVATSAGPKVTTADVYEAVHKATGMDIVADYYTRIYSPGEVTARTATIFDAVSAVSDTMKVRWNKEEGFLVFRSAAFFNDRLKEVPNRLLKKWAASRKTNGALTMDDILEISTLSDPQLHSQTVSDGVQAVHGLAEWGLARNPTLRPHLRLLNKLPAPMRKQAMAESGLAFAQLPVALHADWVAAAMQNVRSPDADLLRTSKVMVSYRLNAETATDADARKDPITITYKAQAQHGGSFTKEVHFNQQRVSFDGPNTRNDNVTRQAP